MRTMTPERFEKLVAEGVQAIPERFLEKLKNVAIVVEEDPNNEKLSSVGMRRGDHLLGLYEGVSNIEGGHTHRGFPDKITIFKNPICAIARREVDIPRIVGETVRHEIAHHFGMSDQEIRRSLRRSR